MRPVVDTARAAKLYNDRFTEFGRDLRTVGWGNAPDQQLRFHTLLRGLAPKGKVVLDVGCGLGDLVPFLHEACSGDFRYVGIDIAGKLVDDARAHHGGSGREFHCGDIFSVDLPPVDIAVLSGALSLKTAGIEAYAQATMERMFSLARESASLNFLSTYADFEAEKNQHYQPEQVFGWAKRLTRHVNLLHDYGLYEFTVQLVR